MNKADLLALKISDLMDQSFTIKCVTCTGKTYPFTVAHGIPEMQVRQFIGYLRCEYCGGENISVTVNGQRLRSWSVTGIRSGFEVDK